MSALQTPSEFDPHSLAEYAEALLVLGEDPYLSASELTANFATGNQPTDTQIDDLFSEIERRGRDYGKLYPFSIEGRGMLIDRAPVSNLYFTLLLLSLKGSPLRRDGDFPRSDPVFDEISLQAVQAVIGDGARGLVFGWPPRGERPTTFPAAVEWVGKRIGVELRDSDIPDHYQDDGVDVFVWKPFPDGRAGFPFIAVQNTVQFGFSRKPRDVVPGHWRDWLKIGVEPTIGFVIPFAMPKGDPWWHTISTSAHVVLDRGRVLHALSAFDPETWESWNGIAAFAQDEIRRFEGLEEETTTIVTRRKPKRGR